MFLQIEVVAGLNNLGDESYNVTAIYGSLNAAHDFKLYFQNFTGLVRGLAVSCLHSSQGMRLAGSGWSRLSFST